MNNFQICRNTSDAIPLYLPQQLYLKPFARLNISVQLPQKKMGKSISNLEVTEQLHSIIIPDVFCVLKVVTTNIEFIRFQAEIDDKNKLKIVINKLDKKTIKLKEFSELLKIRASESKLHFPTRHEWDGFFRDAKNMDEMKPGERPDTIHISNLPIKWFVPHFMLNDNNLKPSEKIFYRVFEKFGNIRYVDIPICDPHRNKMKSEVSGLQTFSFDEEEFFEGYVQFKDYIGFSKMMDSFRGMKLLRKEEDHTFSVNIIVDYDRNKHLSEASIRRRQIVRDRLVKKEIMKEEHKRIKKEEEDKVEEAERKKKNDEKAAKEQRRREREEKRKAKILATLKVNSADEINDKIAKEEKKLLKVQRKLEAIRLVEALFQRIKIKHERNHTAKLKEGDEDELTRMRNISELEVYQQKEKLNRVIEGRVILKNLLLGDQYNCKGSSSSESFSDKEKAGSTAGLSTTQNDWYPGESNSYQMGPLYPNAGPSHYYSNLRGRGARLPRRYFRGRYRGGFRGGKNYAYPRELQEQYYRYFEKFLYENDEYRSRRSYSKSKSRSYSRHRTRSRSRSRSKRYRSRSKRRHRSNSRSSSRSHRRSKRRSSREYRKSKRRERSRSSSYRSIDSSKFISPSRLRMPRSKSWSLPREKNKKRSWSRSGSSETRR